MMKRFSDPLDEFESALHAFLVSDKLPTKGTRKLAEQMVKYAQDNCDREAWAFVFAVFDRYLDEGKRPPLPILYAINEAFTLFRGDDSKNLDAAFFGKRGRGQPKKDGVVDYWWEKTNVSLLQHFLKEHEDKTKTKRRGDKTPLELAHDDLVRVRRAGHGGKTPPGLSLAEIKRQIKRIKKSD